MVLNKYELILAALLWGMKSKGFDSCWTDALAKVWLAVCESGCFGVAEPWLYPCLSSITALDW